MPDANAASVSPLPASRTSFLGREAELSDAEALLESSRLLTITGPGGAGKTCFALELARRAHDRGASRYEGGVFSCFLAPLRDPALVVPTLCRSLSLREQPGRTAIQTVASHVDGQRTLVLMDNLEHLRASAQDLSELLSACTGLTLLVTSRERLRIPGDVDYELPPLRTEEGVALFCERARVAPSPAVEELVRRLEGLPLAIELAAARTSLLSPEQLLERLGRRLDLLKAGPDAEPRQRTLRATIQWSYYLLAEEERALSARLSVFSGGCTVEAAEEVCDADLDGLESLLDKSLLLRRGDRYRMLETVREYAAERLDSSPDAEAVRRRHAEWYSALAGAGEPHLDGGRQASWLGRLDDERSDLRAAASYWFERGRGEELLALVAACWRFWWLRGYWDEGRAWLQRALDLTSEPAPARLEALQGATFLAHLQRDAPGARLFAVQQLAAARAYGSPADVAKALHASANVAVEAGDIDRARGLYEESLGQAGGDPFSRYSLHALGYLALMGGDVRTAVSLLERSLAISEAVDDRAAAADTLGVLAFAALREERLADTVDLVRQSTLLAYELGDQPALASRSLQGAAALLAHRGQGRAAARLLGAAEAITEHLGSGIGPLADEVRRGTLSRIRTTLRGEELEAECAAGRAEPVEAAVAHVLEAIGPEPS